MISWLSLEICFRVDQVLFVYFYVLIVLELWNCTRRLSLQIPCIAVLSLAPIQDLEKVVDVGQLGGLGAPLKSLAIQF